MALFKRTKYSTVRMTAKRDIPAGLWQKCKGCGAMVYRSSLEENSQVCGKCGFHYPLIPQARIESLTDPGTFREIDRAITSTDPLEFGGDGSYAKKIVSSREKTGMASAIVCGTAELDGQPLALGVMDFRFMGASMGSAVGEKVTRLAELALAKRLPLVIVTASGGARMQEGLLSLMQMAKTSGALARLTEAGIPYIVILAHPTTGGVTASFATQGDILLAEPGALIGFAGPRVIKQTTQADLPEGFQTAEFLLEHGLVDRVVPRERLRDEVSLILDYFSAAGRCDAKA